MAAGSRIQLEIKGWVYIQHGEMVRYWGILVDDVTASHKQQPCLHNKSSHKSWSLLDTEEPLYSHPSHGFGLFLLQPLRSSSNLEIPFFSLFNKAHSAFSLLVFWRPSKFDMLNLQGKHLFALGKVNQVKIWIWETTLKVSARLGSWKISARRRQEQVSRNLPLSSSFADSYTCFSA